MKQQPPFQRRGNSRCFSSCRRYPAQGLGRYSGHLLPSAAIPANSSHPPDPRENRGNEGENPNWEGAFAFRLLVSSVSYPGEPGGSSSKLSPGFPASQRRTQPHRRGRNHTQDTAAGRCCGILNALCRCDTAPSHQGSLPSTPGSREPAIF